MGPQITDAELNETLRNRYKQLPKILQDAITSADIEQHLRSLADTNKLHLDQWQLLENEVMMTLLGFQAPEDLTANLEKNVGLEHELSRTLAENISKAVFEPIRQQLEQNLEASEQHAAVPGDELTQSRTFQQASAGAQATPAAPAAPVAPAPAAAVVPATPPPPPPTEKARRAPISEAYGVQQASHERKNIEGDPYREQLT